jgi:uncharacterized membrane protein YtjA (UPF0391 family)
MLQYAVTFFILAIIAALLGFSGMAGTLSWGAQMLFVAFVVLTLVFALVGRRGPTV